MMAEPKVINPADVIFSRILTRTELYTLNEMRQRHKDELRWIARYAVMEGRTKVQDELLNMAIEEAAVWKAAMEIVE